MKKIIMATMLGLSVMTQGMAQGIDAPIRVIVGFSPGGGVDALARLVAQQMEKELNTSVIVENKPGAGGTLAADYVVRTTQPNNTLLFGDSSLLVAPFIYPSVRYDLDKDLTAIGMVGEATLALAVTSEHPAKNLEEFIALAKDPKNPTAYSSVGVGSLHHLAGELLARQTGANLLHIPYRGGAQASQALVSKDVSMSISSIASLMPLIQADKVRLLAVLSEERFPGLPDVPTAGETIEGYVAAPLLFMMAHKDIDPEVAKKFEAKLGEIAKQTELNTQFVQRGSVIKYEDQNFLSEWVITEGERWKRLIKEANVTFN